MEKRRSIEYGGLGQSGYTAGRVEHDHALELELETEYTLHPKPTDDDELLDELATDDRFVGRGGPPQHEDPAFGEQEVAPSEGG